MTKGERKNFCDLWFWIANCFQWQKIIENGNGNKSSIIIITNQLVEIDLFCFLHSFFDGGRANNGIPTLGQTLFGKVVQQIRWAKRGVSVNSTTRLWWFHIQNKISIKLHASICAAVMSARIQWSHKRAGECSGFRCSLPKTGDDFTNIFCQLVFRLTFLSPDSSVTAFTDFLPMSCDACQLVFWWVVFLSTWKNRTTERYF